MDRDIVIALAQECQLIGMRPHLDGIYQEALERFAALVAAHEREKFCDSHCTWRDHHPDCVRADLTDIHSCHPNCDRPICVAVREAVKAEREECAKVCEELKTESDAEFYGHEFAAAIRSRT